MNDGTRTVKLRWPLAIAAAVGLMAGGAGLLYLFAKSSERAPASMPIDFTRGTPTRSLPPSSEAVGAPTMPVTITISQDMAARAGIQVASVASTSEAGDVTVPAVVEPHGYKQVRVTPLAGGRVTRVLVELGRQVTRGQTLAEIYSPELARAQTAYLSAHAALDAARQRLKRTDRLVEIGAASRQEYEEARAEELRLATELEGARSTLILLGMSPARVQQLSSAPQMTSTITVPAPIGGVITTREANVGLNVDPSTQLFTVVDLSTVWVVGSVYERDFGTVRVGTPATVTTEAYSGLALSGKVSYIDPQVDAATRTAKVRVEVVNRDRLLRLGMYVSLTLSGTSSRTVLTVPAAAVQTAGDRTVVYVVDPSQQGRFIERPVTVGARVRDDIQVLAGLSAGETIVTKGSFFVRAERERTNPSGAGPVVAGKPAAPPASPAPNPPAASGVTVQITERGFEPPKVSVPRGERASITFVRRTETTCAKEVVVESQGIRRELPLNQPVTIDIKATSPGEIAFVCGMNMLKGAVIVQ